VCGRAFVSEGVRCSISLVNNNDRQFGRYAQLDCRYIFSRFFYFLRLLVDLAIRPSLPALAIMSSVRTARTVSAPCCWQGGGGGKRRRDDDDRDRRRRDKPKPVDHNVSLIALGPEGTLREIIRLFLETANLGELPSRVLLTGGGQLKPLSARTDAVRRWAMGVMHADQDLIDSRFSELAEAFVHILRCANTRGILDQVIAMLVEMLAERVVALQD